MDLFDLQIIEINNDMCYNSSMIILKVIDIKYSNSIGYIYIDFFSREGKQCGSSCYYLRCRSTEHLPICCILSDATDCKKIDFYDVLCYFHEFGHAIEFIMQPLAFVPKWIRLSEYEEMFSQFFELLPTKQEIFNKLTCLPDFDSTLLRSHMSENNYISSF